MKFDCGINPVDRMVQAHQRRKEWHSWFAWHPVRLADHDCRWLERIERKGQFNTCWDDAWWSYTYRAIPDAAGSLP